MRHDEVGSTRAVRAAWWLAMSALAAILGDPGARAQVATVGGPGHDVVDAVLPMADGGLVVAGRAGTPSSADSDGPVLVARFAPDLGLLWERRIGPSCPGVGLLRVAFVAETRSGDLRVSVSTPAEAEDHVLSPSGDWIASTAAADATSLVAVEPGPGGRVLSLRLDGREFHAQGVAMVRDAGGASLFETAVTEPSSPLIGSYRAWWGADGSILAEMVDCPLNDGFSCHESGALLARLQPDGTGAWSERFTAIACVAGSGRGDTLVDAQWGSLPDTRGLAVHDAEGRRLVVRTLVEPPDRDTTRAAATAVPGGGWLVAGRSPEGRALLMAFDDALAPRWARVLGAADELSSLSHVVVRPDGWAWVAGIAERLHGGSEGRQWLVALVPPDGGDPTACADLAGVPLVLAEMASPGDALPFTASPVPGTARGELPLGPPEIAPTGFAPGSGSCGACAADLYEWDDACGQTLSPLRIGELPRTGNFCDDAEDWTFFPTTPGVSYVLAVTDLGTEADTVIDLVAGDCETVLASDGEGPGPGALLQWDATTEELLHVRLRPASGRPAPEAAYELAFAAPTAPGCEAWQVHHQARAGGTGPALALDPLHVTVTATGDVLSLLHEHDGPFVLQRHDSSGNVLWSRTLPPELDPARWSVVEEMTDGSLLLGGAADACESRLARIEADGTIRSARSLRFSGTGLDCAGGSWPCVVTGIVPQADGSALVLAYLLSDGGAEAVGVLSAWRPDDSVAWARLLYSPDCTSRAGWKQCGQTAVAAMPDGGVVGVSGDVIHRWSPAGDSLWSRKLPHAGPLAPIRDLDANARGVVVVSHDDGLVSLSPDGDVRWRREIDAGEVLVLPDDGALVVSADRLGRLASDGTPVWLVQRGSEHVRQMRRGPRGDVLAAGQGTPWRTCRAPLASPDAFLARFDPAVGPQTGCTETVALAPAAAAAASLLVEPATARAEPSLVTVTALPLAFDAPVGVQILEPCPCQAPGLGAPPEVSPRGSLHPLRVAADGRLTWEPAVLNRAETFRVHRGDVAALRSRLPAECLAHGIVAPEWTDPEPPPSGSGWYYLVAGANGSGAGPAGHGSSGEPRVVATCP